jgi:hypothetical protein
VAEGIRGGISIHNEGQEEVIGRDVIIFLHNISKDRGSSNNAGLLEIDSVT